MKVAIGHSEDFDSKDAVDEALDACAAMLGDLTPQAGLLYAAIDHDFQLILDRVMARYPGLDLVGCTTGGELSSSGGFAEDSLALMLFHSDAVRFGIGLGEGVGADPAGASRRAAAQAMAGLDAPVRLCIATPEGLGVEMTSILAALSEALGADVPVCGGLAADQLRFEQTFQFFRGSVHTDAIPVMLFAGPLSVATGIASGWQPIGKEHRVTQAEGNVVYTIDGEPPSRLWAHYFGDQAIHTITPHLGIAVYPERETGVDNPETGDEAGPFFMSAPARFREDGSMEVLNQIPSGAALRFADALRDDIIDGAAASIAQACRAYAGTRPDAALAFSCAARHLNLGTRVTEEAGLLRERLGDALPWIGFYTNGEFCPLPGSPRAQAHGGTFVTVLLGEG